MLTRRKLQFIEHYIRTLNATESAKLSGYSHRTAKTQGSRLLTKEDVRQAVDKGLESISAQNKITKENALKILWDLAKSPNIKENDRIRAVEVVSKIKKWHKDSDTNKIAVFQQIQEAMSNNKEQDIIPRDRALVEVKST